MNQDQVKENLLLLEPDCEEFSVVFSGKVSKKVNGLYKPDSREIIIHNRNFTEDNSLLYTAVHEFAHHIHFCTSPLPVSSRVHTREFRSILHGLLRRAEEKGIYRNVFEDRPEFVELTRRIRADYIARNGELLKELGALFVRAEELCRKYGARFDDYIERVLGMEKSTASTLIRAHDLDIPAEFGYDTMKMVANLRKPEDRTRALEALAEGNTPDMVKAMTNPPVPKEEEDPVEKLNAERRRIQRTIETLKSRLETIEERLKEYGEPL